MKMTKLDWPRVYAEISVAVFFFFLSPPVLDGRGPKWFETTFKIDFCRRQWNSKAIALVTNGG